VRRFSLGAGRAYAQRAWSRTIARMAYLRLLGKVEIRVAFAVLVVAAVAGVIVWIFAVTGPDSMLPPENWAILAFLYAVMLGLPLALAIGGPIYAFVSYRKAASWPAVVLIGILPGFVILFTMEKQDGLAFWFIGCGLAVASLTHLMHRRGFPRLWRSIERENAL